MLEDILIDTRVTLVDDAYFEAPMILPLSMIGDQGLYGVHQAVTRMMGGQPSEMGYAYSPVRVTKMGVEVLLRRNTAGIKPFSWDRQVLQVGDALNLRCAARFTRQTAKGERMPGEDEAIEKLIKSMHGFQVDSVDHLERLSMECHKAGKSVRLPFWAFMLHVTVVDAEKAATTMIRGVGRSRGLGFGMLIISREAE